MMRRIAFVAAFAFCVAAIAGGSAGAATSKSAFLVFVEPTISASSTGLTLETEFEGSFNVADRTASGGGEYSVMDGTTVLESGTFTLTGLVAFQFYGCGEVEGTALPPNFCGGQATFGFHSTSSAGDQRDGLIVVNCQIHDPGGQAPPGTSEGEGARAKSWHPRAGRITSLRDHGSGHHVLAPDQALATMRGGAANDVGGDFAGDEGNRSHPRVAQPQPSNGWPGLPWWR